MLTLPRRTTIPISFLLIQPMADTSTARRVGHPGWNGKRATNLLRGSSSGSHQSRVGLNYAHSSYDGEQTFLPVEIIGASGTPIERISFTRPSSFSISQNETSWFVADQWAPFHRLSFNLGMRFDNDTVTGSTHIAPRLGFLLALTNDGKTLLKGGGGLFYDRVPLMLPIFEQLPTRTVSRLDANGQASSSTFYQNRITGGLQNPRSTAWNIALERQVTEHLAVRVAYEQRNTGRDFVVAPTSGSGSGVMALSNAGSDSCTISRLAGGIGFHASR